MDFGDRSALEQARALRRREVTSEALTREVLSRIERLNPSLGAFVSVFEARALRAAGAADTRLETGSAGQGPVFLGVPTGIKDLDFVRGSWARMGSRAFRHFWSPVDGPVTARVRRGGFVIVGKLATSELAIMPITETDIHPPCVNPWDLGRAAGGSSGGSASAVAAGVLSIAQASDGAGSIRIPASFCHLVGFKMSRGVLPNFYGPFDPAGMTTVGSVTRTVEDTAAMLDVLVGRSYDPRSPSSGSFLEACSRPPSGLKIGFSDQSPLGEADPAVSAAARGIIGVLEGLGYSVEEGGEVERRALDDFLPIYGYMASCVPVLRESDLQPPTRWLRQQGRKTGRRAVKAMARGLVERIDAHFGDFDVWISPTVPVSPPEIGAWRGLDGEGQFRAAARLGSFTAVYNLSGQPAISLPLGVINGLPVGVQLAARRGQDAMLLALARQIEQASPWSGRRAPLVRPG